MSMYFKDSSTNRYYAALTGEWSSFCGGGVSSIREVTAADIKTNVYNLKQSYDFTRDRCIPPKPAVKDTLSDICVYINENFVKYKAFLHVDEYTNSLLEEHLGKTLLNQHYRIAYTVAGNTTYMWMLKKYIELKGKRAMRDELPTVTDDSIKRVLDCARRSETPSEVINYLAKNTVFNDNGTIKVPSDPPKGYVYTSRYHLTNVSMLGGRVPLRANCRDTAYNTVFIRINPTAVYLKREDASDYASSYVVAPLALKVSSRISALEALLLEIVNGQPADSTTVWLSDNLRDAFNNHSEILDTGAAMNLFHHYNLKNKYSHTCKDGRTIYFRTVPVISGNPNNGGALVMTALVSEHPITERVIR